ncbi:hypothetical protein F441_15834 [Phytophthora nicotianae CJ01A1]|uniref:Uncharacterized protein n=6 Tax=Phytophthora nicotianae TaxID=4792 RepID=W2PTK3_PHYN3|nr:hypothetical protein PPTG_15561 [Phytophthora nicotianae INRA-310]ETI38189.1 hypothetical protein F443_16000 [Phytophthora nicotianae P1569]ETK78401.1 hypothetical protein L915_15547 [Phytophthora nicotianae]ETO66965.1 hypothetical protein F444_15981 [Phytophthora nicotianae P1976]ETP08071.1 hypothetical protein F441_15834 [Phytophthora nicotianae CJ01A1]ETP36123.1 hypothetical protein F442_15844 [Phytophthora nicotianae P10297]KUF93639.1 hypothetical protein AM587_10003496 [Phytophthora n
MSDIKASPPAPSSTSPASPSAVLPGSERPNYRGKCLYKTGKCMNERALKTSGAAHNLCDEHRNRQNQHQRKLDAKNRLHKRERRVSAGAAKGERFAPYPAASKRQSLLPPVDTSGEVDSVDTATETAPVTMPRTPGASSAEAAATTVGTDGATSSSSAAQTPVLATASSGVMFLPNGPQPPQVSYPFVMQDFDGIVVPLPSYLEGQERIEFRSRIYQKVLDFISEECILRFGAKVDPPAVNATATDTVEKSTLPAQSGITELETEHPTSSERDAPTPSEANDISDAQQSSPSGSDESSPSTKKVH